MVSPVDTSVKWMTSQYSNGSTPVLSGLAGAFIAALDKFLLPIGSGGGWDALTVGIVVSGGVATVTFPSSHSSQTNSVVYISGCSGGVTNFANLNGEQKITGRTPGSLSAAFNCPGVGDGTVTGTITLQMAPQGQWAKVFSGTNLASYQSLDTSPGSLRWFLDVDDTGVGYTKIRGYQTMSASGVGTEQFPTVAQQANNTWWKSSLASGVAAPYLLVADSRSIFFYSQSGMPSNGNAQGGTLRYFGDLLPLRVGGDPYAVGMTSSNTLTTTGVPDSLLSTRGVWCWMPRPYTGVASGPAGTPSYGYMGGGTSGLDTYFGAYPNGIDGLLRLSKMFQQAPTVLWPRSEVPGLYLVPQSNVSDLYKSYTQAAGTGPVAGRKLIAVNETTITITTATGIANLTTAFIDITGPWR